jgi:hypothetical protein
MTSKQKAPAALFDTRMVRGLVRAAELLENKDVLQEYCDKIWDDEAREALEFARKIGLATAKPASPLRPCSAPKSSSLNPVLNEELSSVPKTKEVVPLRLQVLHLLLDLSRQALENGDRQAALELIAAHTSLEGT